MFTDMIADLNRAIMPEPVSLRKRFDFALTKKIGVVKLPPAFWMQDPKINPRSDHLLWAALLLVDRSRIELVLAVIEEELGETARLQGLRSTMTMDQTVERAITGLLQQIPDPALRMKLQDDLRTVIPEWMQNKPVSPDA